MLRHYILRVFSHWPADRDTPPTCNARRAGAFASLASAKRAALRMREHFGADTAMVQWCEGGYTMHRWYRYAGSARWEHEIKVPSYD